MTYYRRNDDLYVYASSIYLFYFHAKMLFGLSYFHEEITAGITVKGDSELLKKRKVQQDSNNSNAHQVISVASDSSIRASPGKIKNKSLKKFWKNLGIYRKKIKLINLVNIH